MKKIILACDIGYGNTKLVFGHDLTDESWSEMCFKSDAPKALVDASLLAGGLSGALDRVCIGVNGSTYLVGPEAYISGGGAILSTDFVTRDEYLALLRGSIFYMMKKSGVALKHIDVLVLGLSVSNWRPMQVELSRIAKGPHLVPVPVALRSTYGERVEVTIGPVLVLPQLMGALDNATVVHFQNGKKHAVGSATTSAFDLSVYLQKDKSQSRFG